MSVFNKDDISGGSKDCLDWKLIIDPFLKGKAQMKVVRYAGQVDGSEVCFLDDIWNRWLQVNAITLTPKCAS